MPQHVCTEACGITYDPDCPCWPENQPPPERGSPEWNVRCTPRERLDYQFDLALAAAAKRAAAMLVEALRPHLAALIRETLAADLPDALAALKKRGGRP